MSNKLKLFISYTHKDDDEYKCIESFLKHTAPLVQENLIEIWYDDNVLAGEEFNSEVYENLEKADIVCLFMSANHIFSDPCIKEKTKALELREKNGISVINIILSPCGWQAKKELSNLKALPKDARPISCSNNPEAKWYYVYTELRKIVEQKINIKRLKISESCASFLKCTEMLTNAHSKKTNVFLDDIFVYPELIEHDLSSDTEKKISSEELIENILGYPPLVFAGEGQSGKTSLCKALFKKFRDSDFVPVYIQEKKNLFNRNIGKTIVRSFNKQYEGVNIKEISKKRIVPIIDDFHYAENKERHIKDLSKEYDRFILVVDDICNINIKDEELIGSFKRFQIAEFKASLRYELTNKWVRLTDKETNNYKSVDGTIELIDSVLGRTIGSGIMPAYPFFILSAIVSWETFQFDKEITSQGYCYQALIYFYLKKKGLTNAEIDSIINFLKELAYHLYKEKKSKLNQQEFESFLESYLEDYLLEIDRKNLLQTLNPIIIVSGFNHYSFQYPYLYFFFVANYLADNIVEPEIHDEIDKIMEHLQLDENAYIAIFLSHHSKNTLILNKIEDIISNLFKKYEPSKLTKDEVEFFDDQIDYLVESVLDYTTTPDSERGKKLEREDELEEIKNKSKEKKEPDNEVGIDLRRAMKTSEVIGCIIKNRYGSIKKNKLEDIFNETMNLYLRILTYYFNLISNEDGQKTLIDILSKIIKKDIEENEENDAPSDEEMKKMAEYIFWNLSFLFVNGILYKIIHSLGSDKLYDVMTKVCDETDTPSSVIVKHGILMWYNKSLELDEIAEKVKDIEFSKVGERTLRNMIVNYCSLHYHKHGELREVKNKLGIPVQEILTDGHTKD